MRWSLAGILGVATCVLLVSIPNARFVGLIGVTTLGMLVAWRFGICHHPGPLGLLPPLTNPDGTRTPAQWFCDRCGKSWSAAFDHESHPVQRFNGYDQSKASDAARRAEELTKRQRALALRRAGIEPNRKPRLRPDAAEVVPIRHFVK